MFFLTRLSRVLGFSDLGLDVLGVYSFSVLGLGL